MTAEMNTLFTDREPRDRILRVEQVTAMVGLSETTIWRMRNKGEFPKPKKLTSNSIGWLESEVVEWIRSRPAIV